MGAAPPGAARVADLRASFREQGWSERLVRAQFVRRGRGELAGGQHFGWGRGQNTSQPNRHPRRFCASRSPRQPRLWVRASRRLTCARAAAAKANWRAPSPSLCRRRSSRGPWMAQSGLGPAAGRRRRHAAPRCWLPPWCCCWGQHPRLGPASLRPSRPLLRSGAASSAQLSRRQKG